MFWMDEDLIIFPDDDCIKYSAVHYSAGAVSSAPVRKAQDMGFMGSEQVGFVSDHHQDTQRSVNFKQRKENQSATEKAEQQLRQL